MENRDPERLIERAAESPGEVLEECTELLIDLRDGLERAGVERAMGFALRWNGDLAKSVDTFQKAAERCAAHGDMHGWAISMISITGTMTIGGEIRQALDLLDSLGDRIPNSCLGRFHFQRGTILIRLGELEAGMSAFDLAEPLLHEWQEYRHLAGLYKNRAMLHLMAMEVGEAHRDVDRARWLFQKLGDDRELAMCDHNLGLVLMAKGELARAIHHLNRSDASPHLEGPALLTPGRCEALLAAGLFEDALEDARRKAEGLAAAGLMTDHAEMLLTAAEAAILAGHGPLAQELGTRATTEFEKQQRTGWASRSALVALAATEPSNVPLDRLEGVIEDLDRSGLAMASAKAMALAARVNAARGRITEARAMADRAARRIAYPPLDLHTDLVLTEVEVRIAEGDRAGAARAASHGMRVLARHQRTAGATDVRAGMARHAVAIANRGLELAIDSRQPRRVWEWMERGRATALRFRPVTPEPDEAVAAGLAELRGISARLRTARHDDAAELRDRQRVLERSIANHARGFTADDDRPERVGLVLDRAIEELGSTTFIQMSVVAGSVWAVVVRDGSPRLFDLGDADEWLRHARVVSSAMKRALTQRHEETRVERLRTLCRDFGAPIRRFIPEDQPVIIVPTRDLSGVPWNAVLRPSATHVRVSPSTRSWLTARAIPATRNQTTLCVAGPDLDHAELEVLAVAACHDGAIVLSDARVDDVRERVPRSDLLHLACHGHFRPDQPLFTSIRLTDGDLYLHEWQQLSHPPRTVVLSSCETGSVQPLGREMLGMASIMLSCGTRSVTASTWPVPDGTELADVMVEFHRQIAAGVAPAAALAAVPRSGQHGVIADAFTVFGA